MRRRPGCWGKRNNVSHCCRVGSREPPTNGSSRLCTRIVSVESLWRDYNESGKIFVRSCRCEARGAVVGGAGLCPIHHQSLHGRVTACSAVDRGSHRLSLPTGNQGLVVLGAPSWTRRFCGQKVGGQNGRAQSFVSKDPRSTGSPVRMASDVILCRRSPIISCASCNQFSHRGSQQPMMRTCGVSFGSCISHGGLGLRSAVRGRIIAYSASWRHTPKNP